MSLRLLAAALLASLPVSTVTAQSIDAPPHVIAGSPVPIRVSGLPAGAEIELVAEQRSNVPLRSTARFRVRRSGVIDLARDAPVSGDYAGRDPAGLLWSMQRSEGAAANLADNRIRLTVNRDGRALATRIVEVLRADPAVAVTPVEGFAGATLHRRAGDARRLPVVILLGGSEGGDIFGRDMVPFITGEGYAALVLPYYAPPWVARPALAGLPTNFADIPVDRLDAVRDWIARQPDLDAARIAIVGASKGAEFAMLAASHFPWPRAIVGFVPSDVVWEGWGPGVPNPATRSSFSWAGAPLPFVPYTGMGEAIAAMGRGERVSLSPVHANGRRDHFGAVGPATISVERFAGPMMVIGGGRDSVWPSADMARRIAERRAAAGRPTELLVYPEAGHALSGSGWSSLRAWGDDGTAAATAAAQRQIRPRLARFLQNAFASANIK